VPITPSDLHVHFPEVVIHSNSVCGFYLARDGTSRTGSFLICRTSQLIALEYQSKSMQRIRILSLALLSTLAAASAAVAGPFSINAVPQRPEAAPAPRQAAAPGPFN